MKPAPKTVKEFAAMHKEKMYRIECELEYIKITKNGLNLAPLPEKLRPAEPKDIVPGNVIWYYTPGKFNYMVSDNDGEHKTEHFWKIVGKVFNTGDVFRGYSDIDDCIYGGMYGLNNAFVEVEDDN